MPLITDCLGLSAPYYNLVLVGVVVALFIYLLRLPNKKVFNEPWKYLFLAIIIYIVEELLTILKAADLISFPHFIFGIFEMAIIGLFIYMCLLQKEHLK